MDKEKIEKRILEEYDEFVFQGYSTEEIAFMGTCLQRWAIEKRVGPANIKPGSQYECDGLCEQCPRRKNDCEMWADHSPVPE